MSLRLTTKTPSRRPLRIILLLSLISLMLIAAVAWQSRRLPDDVLAFIDDRVAYYSPSAAAQASQGLVETSSQAVVSGTETTTLSQPQPNPQPIVQVASEVIPNPGSESYTSQLYEDTGDQEIPWPNAGGRTKVEFYTVQSGDTLWSIADQFDIDLDTLRWSNPDLERNPDVLSVGADLLIIPVQGAYHRVVAGETAATIAAQYGVSETDITDYPPNALYPPYDFEAGQGLIIPFGRKDGLTLPQPSLAAESQFAWPVAGVITQGYHPDHLALDFGAPYGSTIYASADGTIVHSQWAATGYGYTIIIDHGDGWETWYSHLKGALLGSGAFVTRGTAIGEVGSTGRSTGPHVHFEIRQNGQLVNPANYLPSSPN
ncbi:MAG: peptidoglycan DD-metalloendopeptidase family protein [Chloroflexota bacterium]